MTRSDDPYGRRSLFSSPGAGEAVAEDDVWAPGVSGRRSLYSAADATPAGAVGPIDLECSRCGVHSGLDPVSALVRLVPSLWWPLRRHSRYLRCPACGRWAWCRLRLGG